MAHAPIWVACLMVPLCVTACSKKDNHVYIPDEAEALSERIQIQSNPVPVLVTAEQLKPLTPSEAVDEGALESFHQQLTDKQQQADWQTFRQQLKLKPDQIVWLGSQRRRFKEDFNPVDLRQTDAYPQANQLMINYFRRLKSPNSIEAQLELALNVLHAPVCFNADDQDAYNAIEYDADHETLSLRTSIPYVTEKEVLAQAYNPNFDGQQVEVLKVELHYPLAQAKSNLADLKRGTCLGYLLQLDAGQRLTVKQLILSAYSSDTAIPQPVVYRFQPQQLRYDLYQEQQEVTRRDDGTRDYHPKPRQLLHSTDIPIPQQIDYRFGLANTPVETQGAADE